MDNLKSQKEYLKCVGCFLTMFLLGIVLLCVTEQMQRCKQIKPLQKVPETEYEWTLAKLQELEQIAETYDETQAELLTYIYVRCKRYTTLSWVMMAGALPEEFQTYLEDNQTKDLQALQTQNILELPNGEPCDFVHMIAVINMIERGYPVVGGWGGDLVQLASNIKECSGSFNELLTEAKKRLGAEDGLFNEMDIYADMDAVNLHQRKAESGALISEVMEGYYATIDIKSRVNEFIKNQFQRANVTNTELRECVYQVFEENDWVQLLCKNYGVDTEVYAEHRRAVAYAFADYCYTNKE